MRRPRPQSHLDPVDFESLPPALRRKYFSSLERLRFAQDGQRFSPPLRRPNSVKAAKQYLSSLAELNSRLSHSRPVLVIGRRLRKRRQGTRENPITAEWFASLPPAVQRKLFSEAECTEFVQPRRPIILDAADELLHRRHRLSQPHLLSFGSRRTSDDDTIIGTEEWEHSCCDSADEMADYTIDGLSWLEEEKELDLKLDDYHQVIADTARRQAEMDVTRTHRRRNTSLSTLSFRRRRSSTSSSRPQLEDTNSFVLPIASTTASHSRSASRAPSRIHSRTPSLSIKHIRSQGSISSIDPRATHYQDPAARMKLRLYLASPQKFDEAIEFGFPSLQKSPTFAMDRPKTSPALRSADIGRTFFHDDTPELSGDEENDSDEPDTSLDPRTPEDPVFQLHRPSVPTLPAIPKSSLDAISFSKPRTNYARRMTETYARGTAADREMTLHMTLTRPDLRSPEEQPLGSHPNVTALASEQPEVGTEATVSPSIWDTLPPEESKVKKFLRKLKLK